MIKENNTKNNIILHIKKYDDFILLKPKERVNISEEFDVYSKITDTLPILEKVIKIR